MKNAAAKGKQIGRPETTKDRLPDKFWKYYQMYKSGDINISEMAHIMDCSRASIYKYIKKRRWIDYPSPSYYSSQSIIKYGLILCLEAFDNNAPDEATLHLDIMSFSVFSKR